MPSSFTGAHQSRITEHTVAEDLLADALERAFGQGAVEIDELVQHLNNASVPAPGGIEWTESLLRRELQRLGD